MKMNHTRSLLVLFLVCASMVLLGHPAAAAPGGEGETSGFVAYYFHGNMRCATCRTIEAYSEEAITTGFADELASGHLVWMAVNTDQPQHKHFVTDFELVTKSLVLVEYHQGEVVRFKNLDKIWKLVGDKDAFLDYVDRETKEFLGSS